MTYRIQVGSGDKKGQWVRTYPDGSFQYVTHDKATLFPSPTAAEAALKTRGGPEKGNPVSWAWDFNIVADYGTFGTPGAPRDIFAKVESTPGTARPQAYRFIGGPKDGEKLVLQDDYHTYSFPLALGLKALSGRAVYVRQKMGVNPPSGHPAQQHEVYVFSHIEGLVPARPGENVLFEGRVWTINDISWARNRPVSRFEARTSWVGGQARLSGDLYDLYYVWDREVWSFKSKSIVNIDESRTVVVG